MGYAIGVLAAMLVSAFARVTGFDRDRAFFPTVLVVVAHYYLLFAAIGGSTRAFLIESLTMAAFVLLAVAGFKRGPALVATGLIAHGVFDVLHSGIVSNPGVPEWWPAFCMAFDVVAGVLVMVVPTPDRTARGIASATPPA
jgi:hypothetical protein